MNDKTFDHVYTTATEPTIHMGFTVKASFVAYAFRCITYIKVRMSIGWVNRPPLPKRICTCEFIKGGINGSERWGCLLV